MAVAIPLIAGGIGAWAGSATIGAAAGWAIGSAAGSILEQKLFGPQIPPNALTDLTVQTSAWGTGLPDIFGVQRVAGNIIWSTDKMLVGGNQGKYGGKGGGGGKGSSKGGKKGTGSQGYYEVAIAFALCEGPVAGIKRIWAGGDLIYDDSAPVYVPSMDPNNPQGSYQQFTSTNAPLSSTGGSSLGSWTLYHGTGEQGPDGTIVANGSGNGAGGIPYQQVTLANGFEYTYGAPAFGKLGAACAYRGVAYIVFPNLNIGYGGTIPPLTFEVVGRQVSGVQYEAMSVVKAGTTPTGWANPTWYGQMADGESVVCVTGAGYTPGNNVGTSYAWSQLAGLINTRTGSFTPINSPFYSSVNDFSAVYSQAVQAGSTIAYGGGDLGFGSAPNGTIQTTGINTNSPGSTLAGSLNGVGWFVTTHGIGNSFESPSYISSTASPYNLNYATAFSYNAAYNILVNPLNSQLPALNGSLWFVSQNGPTLVGFNGASFSYAAITGLPGVPSLIFSDGSKLYAAFILPSNQGQIYTIDTSTAVATLFLNFSIPAIASLYTSILFWAGGSLYGYFGNLYGTTTALVIFNADGTIRSTLWNTVNHYQFIYPMNLGIFFAGQGSNTGWQVISYGDRVAPNPFNLQAVIEQVCTRAGFTNYDVSLVPTTDVNLTRHAGTAARDVLKVLCQIYALDMVDSAGLLRFVPRGQPIGAQLQMSDIGFAADSKSIPPAPYVMTRAPEVDLPRSLTLKYTSALANYNTYAQTFQISAAATYGKDVTVSAPLTLDDSTALNAAMLLAVAPHIEKTAYTWTTNFNWLQLEPGDVVQAPWGVTRITQVTLRDTQKQPLIEFQGVIDASYVLGSGNGQAQAVATPTLAATLSPQAALSSASGGNLVSTNQGPASNTSSTPAKTPPFIGVAYSQFLEVPPLKSTDTSPYYLIAPYSTGTAFVGAAVYESTDGGTTFTELAQQANASVCGVCSNALADTQPWTWDNASTLTVYLNAGYMQLSSATDTQVIQGANLALVGDELIQFANAQLLTDSSGATYYQLSRLLRGRRGTEWAMANHALGENFVLLQVDDETTVNYALSALNNPYEFKIATVGQSIAAVNATSFAPTGIWYKPWAVAQLTAVPNSSAAWVVTFEPRARLNGVWGSGVAPALDPDTTTYSIDIFDQHGSLRRTVSGPLTSPTTFVYTLAMQQADGTSAGAITFNVYQVGTLGRGYVASITT